MKFVCVRLFSLLVGLSIAESVLGANVDCRSLRLLNEIHNEPMWVRVGNGETVFYSGRPKSYSTSIDFPMEAPFVVVEFKRSVCCLKVSAKYKITYSGDKRYDTAVFAPMFAGASCRLIKQ